jgi:uncharacterized protein (TIGR03435 family)
VDKQIRGNLLVTIAAVMMVTACQVNGQSPQSTNAPGAESAFEVASVKPVPPPYPAGGGPWIVTHGRFRAETGWVRAVVAWAYNVSTAQVKGAPDWIDRELYYFDARAENQEAGPDQVRFMLQALLAERFKLIVHRDTQQGQVYRLTVGKNGSKLQDAKDGRKNFIDFNGPGRITFTENQTLVGLANVLTNLLSAPILDETGLKDSYNFSLEFADPRDPRAEQADSRPDLFSAVQDQLGLRLQADKGPVETLVVDHVERPSAN